MDAHGGFVAGVAGLVEAGALVMLWILERSTLRIERQREADAVRVDVLIRLRTQPNGLEFYNLCSVPVLVDYIDVFIRDREGLSDPFRAAPLGIIVREYGVWNPDISHWIKSAAEAASKGPIAGPHNIEVTVGFFAHHSWHVGRSENAILAKLQ
jgi:hypothetical protein